MRKLSRNLILVAALWASACCAQNTTFTTIASSPFTMSLCPTLRNLNVAAAATVQQAVSTTLHLASRDNLTSMPTLGWFQVIIQQVDWQSAGKDPNSSLQVLPTTTINFGVLASFVTSSIDLSVSELDSYVITTFASQTYEATFEKLLVTSGNTRWKDVVTVEVVALPPTTEPANEPDPPSKTRVFSKVDIVLLVISGCIFLGVAYMIYRHHFDQGYIETQRMRYFSRPAPTSYSTTSLPFHGCHSPAAVDCVEHNHKNVVAPETRSAADKKDDPPTPSTADIAPESPEHLYRPPTPVNTPSPDLSNIHKVIHEADTTEPVSNSNIAMPEVFTSKWFKSQESRLGEVDASATGNFVSSESDDRDEDDDDDVFHMDVAQMSPLSQDSSKPPRPAAKRTLLSDWMKGIRVVSSDKTSETTIHSMERSSPVAVGSVNTSNRERFSPEHSMARSTVVVIDVPQQKLEI